MKLTSKKCSCGSQITLEVADADYVRWQHGTHIQDAFPYLSVDDRERLITGICPECWDRMFDADLEYDDGWCNTDESDYIESDDIDA